MLSSHCPTHAVPTHLYKEIYPPATHAISCLAQCGPMSMAPHSLTSFLLLCPAFRLISVLNPPTSWAGKWLHLCKCRVLRIIWPCLCMFPVLSPSCPVNMFMSIFVALVMWPMATVVTNFDLQIKNPFYVRNLPWFKNALGVVSANPSSLFHSSMIRCL